MAHPIRENIPDIVRTALMPAKGLLIPVAPAPVPDPSVMISFDYPGHREYLLRPFGADAHATIRPYGCGAASQRFRRRVRLKQKITRQDHQGGLYKTVPFPGDRQTTH